ncbi:MAG: hemerythrin domain-containing protein [Thermoleophilia bacterium]
MQRHPSLVPLSHDHHHALVAARRLRRAADLDAASRLDAALAFVAFFRAETVEHFRVEEERLFPLAVSGDDAPALVVEALAQHARLHARVQGLERAAAAGEAPGDAMHELADALHDHVRLEERELFPLIEATASEAALRELAPAATGAGAELVDLGEGEGHGPLWGTASDDLNATLLAWPPGGGVAEHVNAERDVLYVVVDGSGRAIVDGVEHPLAAPCALLVRKGSARRVEAGPDGLRYVTAHLRRPGLSIASAAPAG